MTNLKETLEQFRKLDASKTKGEWHKKKYQPHNRLATTAYLQADGKSIADLRYSNGDNNMAFIAYAANNALPALEQAMAEIERKERALKSCLRWMEELRASGDAGFWDWDDNSVYTKANEALIGETTE